MEIKENMVISIKDKDFGEINFDVYKNLEGKFYAEQEGKYGNRLNSFNAIQKLLKEYKEIEYADMFYSALGDTKRLLVCRGMSLKDVEKMIEIRDKAERKVMELFYSKYNKTTNTTKQGDIEIGETTNI